MSPPKNGYQVLIVDDDPLAREMEEKVLFRRGITSLSAGNGKEAVDFFRQHRFDVILMDIQMPEMDGIEATQLIREAEAESGGHVPIIAITGYAIPGDDERCRRAGMDDYITKPIHLPTFIGLIERYLGRQ